MIPSFRDDFNRRFRDEDYHNLIRSLEAIAGNTLPFRVAETPVFIPASLKEKLLDACSQMMDALPEIISNKRFDAAIPNDCRVPGTEGPPLFLAFDFAVCKNQSGETEPMLIELQGFPSLFFYQHELALQYRKHFSIAERFNHHFSENDATFVARLRDQLLNGHDPNEVVLLDIEPEKQATYIDFIATAKHTGIRPLCISKVILRNRKLYYLNEGREIRIRRIFNRVIFDELKKRKDLPLQYHLTEEAEVEWTGHPNHYFRVSKFTMPFLKFPFVPETRFVSELNGIPPELDQYVLKPLFSFAGSGVEYDVTPAHIENIAHPEQWILQKKVDYAPVVNAPDNGGVRVEIRMMYGRESDGRYLPIINMCRLSRGKMIGVRYNRDMTWVGSSVGFME